MHCPGPGATNRLDHMRAWLAARVDGIELDQATRQSQFGEE